jgi:hypothetical membrane protein
MRKSSIIGILIMALGIAMFFFGASMFSYQGNSLSPIVSAIGKYSFLYFFPTIVIGAMILLFGQLLKKR